MSVIEVENLVKTYNDVSVVDGISFSVEEGEIFAHPRPQTGLFQRPSGGPALGESTAQGVSVTDDLSLVLGLVLE